jgi:hypothetical protein
MKPEIATFCKYLLQKLIKKSQFAGVTRIEKYILLQKSARFSFLIGDRATAEIELLPEVEKREQQNDLNTPDSPFPRFAFC